jgi:hypothetical protein
LLWYFAIWPRNILLAAYFPTIAAMFAVFLCVDLAIKWYVDQSSEVDIRDLTKVMKRFKNSKNC